MSSFFFKALVQVVLLSVLEAWVVTPPPHWQRPGGVSGPGGATFDRTSPAEDTGQKTDTHLGGDGTIGGGVIDDGIIHQAAPEHSCAVHRYAITV